MRVNMDNHTMDMIRGVDVGPMMIDQFVASLIMQAVLYDVQMDQNIATQQLIADLRDILKPEQSNG